MLIVNFLTMFDVWSSVDADLIFPIVCNNKVAARPAIFHLSVSSVKLDFFIAKKSQFFN